MLATNGDCCYYFFAPSINNSYHMNTLEDLYDISLSTFSYGNNSYSNTNATNIIFGDNNIVCCCYSTTIGQKIKNCSNCNLTISNSNTYLINENDCSVLINNRQNCINLTSSYIFLCNNNNYINICCNDNSNITEIKLNGTYYYCYCHNDCAAGSNYERYFANYLNSKCIIYLGKTISSSEGYCLLKDIFIDIGIYSEGQCCCYYSENPAVAKISLSKVYGEFCCCISPSCIVFNNRCISYKFESGVSEDISFKEIITIDY